MTETTTAPAPERAALPALVTPCHSAPLSISTSWESSGFEDVTALAADGTTVIMGQNTKWRRTSIQERITFINRPATDPDA